MNRALPLVALLALTTLNAGCTAVGVGATVGSTAGVAAAREGGLTQSLEDAKISATIHNLWLQNSAEMYLKLSLSVDQARVLITGVVQKPQDRVDAVRLAWQAPAACPDAGALRSRVERRLGHALDDAPISIDVEELGSRYVAQVDLGDDDVRTLTSARCEDLADAVAVIVARAAGEHHAPPKQVAVVEPDEPAVVLHTALTPPHVRTWSIGARLSGVSGVGIIPEVGLGGELALTLRRKSTMAELAATRWAVSKAQLHGGGPAHVDVGLDVTAMRIGWRSAQLPLRGWASVEVGTSNS